MNLFAEHFSYLSSQLGKNLAHLQKKKRIETIHKWFTYLNNIPSRFQSGESKGANIEIHERIFIGNCLVKSCSLNMKETKHKKVTKILWFQYTNSINLFLANKPNIPLSIWIQHIFSEDKCLSLNTLFKTVKANTMCKWNAVFYSLVGFFW